MPSTSALALCGALLVAAPPNVPGGPAHGAVPARVVRATLATWVHGVTEEIARAEIGLEGVPGLVALLDDPGFPRPDNVVAFLAWLGDPGAGRRLAALADAPPTAGRPEDDRAFLLAPQALGLLARRGDRASLETLLRWTGGERDRGAGDRDEAALRGLALSGTPEARSRLEALARGTLRPDLARPAEQVLAALGVPSGGTVVLPSPDEEEESRPAALDVRARVHESALSFANHAALASKMTEPRLDQVLAEASSRAGRADHAGDVACCATVRRGGSAATFGSAGDGLDVIDTATELSFVLDDPRARVKVVRQINWCGAPGLNIVGCGRFPGHGVAVVRLSGLSQEAILWLHEYGHNAGLGHVADTRAIMHGTNTGTNGGISQAECDAWHAPSASALADPVDVGACLDGDLDGVHERVDNCPTAPNPTQADADADGAGDACDAPDADGDGASDETDCAPADPAVWEPPAEVASLSVTAGPPTALTWSGDAGSTFVVAGADLASLQAVGTGGAPCLAFTGTAREWTDLRGAPAPGSGFYYLVRGANPCGSGSWGSVSSGSPRVLLCP